MKKSLVILIVAVVVTSIAAYGVSVTTNNSNSSNSTTSYKDGTYTGSSETNIYETVKVSIVVSGGKITQVDTPVLNITHGGESMMICNRALPTLKSQVIAKQSSKIDGVSGATEITNSFTTSLDVALLAAKA